MEPTTRIHAFLTRLINSPEHEFMNWDDKSPDFNEPMSLRCGSRLNVAAGNGR